VVRAAGAANNSMEWKEPMNIEPLKRSNIQRTFHSSRGR